MKRIPELLAPAGDLNAALTAFEQGADAVYAGLTRFNARERSENFSFKEFGQLMRYAVNRRKKVYLTFNTLIKEPEMQEALTMLSKSSRLLPDAVIVQDLGVLKLMQKYFPHIPVHASTQMGIHNSAGMAFAKRHGIERVILERQLTLKELREIKKNSETEIEVFVHGALCCSLSGVCLFSSWIGGHSGNRGKCKQPCRRRYFSPDGNGFFFSMNDLYTLDHIPALKNIGVSSLKIEGRLRKSDYVAAVVRAYRMVLDAKDEEVPAILPEVRRILSAALGRKWSGGFLDKANFSSLIELHKPGSSGKQLAYVTGVRDKGFFLHANHRLKVGDIIRIQPKSGEEGPAIQVTKITKNKKLARQVKAGEQAYIHCDKKVPQDGIVYKIGVFVKDQNKLIEQLDAPEFLLKLALQVETKSLGVSIEDHPHLPPWKMALSFPIAQKHAVRAESFIEEFLKTRAERIGIKEVKAHVEGHLFISQRDIRKMRQAFEEWLKQHYSPAPEAIYKAEAIEAATEAPLHTIALKQPSLLPDNISCDVLAVEEDPRKEDEFILPAFCPETELPALKKKIDDLIRQGIRTFRVTSLFQFELLRSYEGLRLHTSFPLAVTNSGAFDLLLAEGAEKLQLWVELEAAVIHQLASRYGSRAEIYRYGRLPLLQSRAILPVEGKIKDSGGKEYIVLREENLSTVYASAVFSIPQEELPAVSLFSDLRQAMTDEDRLSSFNYERELV